MSRIIRNSNNRVRNLHFDPASNDLESTNISSDITEQKGTSPKDAKQKTNTAIEETKIRVQQIEHEAYEKGYQEGLDFAMAETAKMLETVKSIATQALEEKWRVINSVEENIIDLAIEIAEKVVSEQVTVDRNVIVHVAKKALMIAAEHEHIDIRVNPDDLETIRSHKEELMSIMDGIEKIEIIADRRIRRGGCIFETSKGNVDARIQSQLYQAEQSLREVVNSDEIRD